MYEFAALSNISVCLIAGVLDRIHLFALNLVARFVISAARLSIDVCQLLI